MRKNQWALVAVALVMGIVFGVSAVALTAERHPQIHAAMRALRQAANHLEKAEHVFGGHRAKALELVKQAENELKQALEYAKEHTSSGKPAPGKGAPSTQPAPAAKTQ